MTRQTASMDMVETVARAIADYREPGTDSFREIFLAMHVRSVGFGPRAGSLDKLFQELARLAIEAHNTALDLAGFVVVPREASEAMLQGACEKHVPGQPMSATTGHQNSVSDEECPRFETRRRIWQRMIDAALSPDKPND